MKVTRRPFAVERRRVRRAPDQPLDYFGVLTERVGPDGKHSLEGIIGGERYVGFEDKSPRSAGTRTWRLHVQKLTRYRRPGSAAP
jgi:hypothetical protein